jgi:hypothetical protein
LISFLLRGPIFPCKRTAGKQIRKETTLKQENKLRREEGGAQADRTAEVHSFDNLAIGLAEGIFTRGQALKYMGVVLLGGLGAMAGIGVFTDDADARRRRKKKKKRGVGTSSQSSPLPRTCTAGDAATCTSCGPSPTTGNICSCLPNLFGNPTCIDTKKGTFQSCNSNNDCPTGSTCIEEFVCGKPPGTFSCAFPCGS